jgi:hypothetical protein
VGANVNVLKGADEDPEVMVLLVVTEELELVTEELELVTEELELVTEEVDRVEDEDVEFFDTSGRGAARAEPAKAARRRSWSCMSEKASV